MKLDKIDNSNNSIELLDTILDNISKNTDELKEIAQETNLILTEQNNKLNTITNCVELTNEKIKDATGKINKLLSTKNMSFINGISTGVIASSIAVGTLGVVSLGSIPLLGTSLIVTGTVATGTIGLNYISNKLNK